MQAFRNRDEPEREGEGVSLYHPPPLPPPQENVLSSPQQDSYLKDSSEVICLHTMLGPSDVVNESSESQRSSSDFNFVQVENRKVRETASATFVFGKDEPIQSNERCDLSPFQQGSYASEDREQEVVEEKVHRDLNVSTNHFLDHSLCFIDSLLSL